MRLRTLLFMLLLAAAPALAQTAPMAVDRVRFFPAKNHASAMVGGKIAGSNTSATEGYHLLAEIKAEPKEGEWGELSFPNQTPYRWVRYEAPPGSHGAVAELEFYAGEHKLRGGGFGSPGAGWKAAFDAKPDTFFNSANPDGQYAGLDVGEQASTLPPAITPGEGTYDTPQTVKLVPRTPGSTIRYTLDGTLPGAHDGEAYTAPLAVEKNTTITAVAFSEGLAPSPAISANLWIGQAQRPALRTFHVGNSLTGNASRFRIFIRTAGGTDPFPAFLIGGSTTERLWNGHETDKKAEWEQAWAAAQAPLEHFTMQPRDFDIAREADYCTRFIQLVREKGPDVQPWLYAEWVEANRQRPSDKGLVPSSQMQKTFPALTWQESMGAMLLYNEEVQKQIAARNPGGKPVRIIPTCLAMGWARTLVDGGAMPGVSPGEASYYSFLFDDQVHVNPAGCYLVDLTWYGALLRESPEARLLPIGTGLSAAQADVVQKLAWDVIRNYPDCGLYEEGTEKCAKPGISSDGKTIRLSSATPGAWFRYTLDGTAPTRTRGYVYCGVISIQPGIHVKAIAYRSGMADSDVAEQAE